MAVTELTLWAARLLVLVLMYGFLLALILALFADARGATAAPRDAVPIPRSPRAPRAQPAAPAIPTTLTLAITGGASYELSGPTVLGRDANSDIVIPSTFASKRHASISRQVDGWTVEDLGSTNGTLLNGAPLMAPQRLKAGDRIVIGDTEIVVGNKK